MTFLSDLRYSARSLARAPGLLLALLLTIALGVGSNASVFGFIRGLVTPEQPLPGIDRLVSVFSRDARDTFRPVSYEDYLLLCQVDVFESLGAAQESRHRLTVGERTSLVAGAAVTPAIAGILGLPPGTGIVVSDRLWRSEFAGSGDAGSHVRIDGVEMPVSGVAPEWLEGLFVGRDVDVWLPLRPEVLHGASRTSLTFSVLGRLRADVSAGRAHAAVNALQRPGAAMAVLPYTGLTPEAATGLSRLGRLLPAAAGMVFLIACANVAAILLARATARAHETSVRVALGATRGRLGRQLLSDSILISAAGGALGVLLAVWTAYILPALLFAEDAERLVFSPDLSAIVAASIVCAGITVACGLLPLLEVRHDDPASVLKRESAGPTKAMLRVRSGLVVIQLASCCMLVISSSLLMEGFRSALRTRAASRLGQPIIATLTAPLRFSRPDLGLEYFRDAEKAVMSLPGVSASAWVSRLPGASAAWYPVRIEQAGLAVREVKLDVVAFTAESLDLITLPPVAGRMFGGADTPQSCKVAILNEEAAADVFDGEAVGRILEDPAGQRIEVIGVVSSRKTARSTTPDRPTVYYYAEQTGTFGRVTAETFRVQSGREVMATAFLDTNVVSPGYFDAMGLSVTAGTAFPSGEQSRGCRIGVINEEAAELYFGGHAVGGAVIDGTGRRTEIVGVTRSSMLGAAQRLIEPAIYLPMTQDFLPRLTLLLGTREATEPLLSEVRRRLEGVTGSAGAPAVLTLDEHLSKTALAPERIATLLVGSAAVVALALGVLGLYGGMGEFVRQRRREFAVRVALGAQRRNVIALVLAAGARLAGIGAVAGGLGSILVVRWLASVTPNIGAVTIWVWLTGPLVLVAAVVVAGLLPARRALLVDPLTIMRDN